MSDSFLPRLKPYASKEFFSLVDQYCNAGIKFIVAYLTHFTTAVYGTIATNISADCSKVVLKSYI